MSNVAFLCQVFAGSSPAKASARTSELMSHAPHGPRRRLRRRAAEQCRHRLADEQAKTNASRRTQAQRRLRDAVVEHDVAQPATMLACTEGAARAGCRGRDGSHSTARLLLAGQQYYRHCLVCCAADYPSCWSPSACARGRTIGLRAGSPLACLPGVSIFRTQSGRICGAVRPWRWSASLCRSSRSRPLRLIGISFTVKVAEWWLSRIDPAGYKRL